MDGVTGEIDLTLSSPGTYTIDYQYSQGTVSYFVSINSIDLTTDIVTACDSYTWIDGNTYSSSNNTATFTSTNAAGCDSIITLDLTIVPNPDLSVTQNGATLTSDRFGNVSSAYYFDGFNDYWIVKLYNTGNITWQKYLGASSGM